MGQHSEYDTEFNNLTFDEYKLDIGQPSGVPLIAAAMDNINAAKDDTLVIFYSFPGTACPMVEVVKNSDYILLVTEPTPFGLHDLKLAVQTVKQMNVEMGILINKSGSGNDNIITDFCKSEDLPILGRIPQSQLIAEAYSRGELVYFLNDEIKSAWQNFANSLLQNIN